MKWLLGVSATALVIVAVEIEGCGTTSGCPSCADGGPDSSCPSPVSGGQACAAAGATACGFAPVCTDIGGGTTTCTCSSGKWDCGKCPACGASVTLGAPCGIGQTCSGPTSAKLCDGTSQAVTGNCYCGGGGPGNGWSCDGVTAVTCDAGTDASDASKD